MPVWSLVTSRWYTYQSHLLCNKNVHCSLAFELFDKAWTQADITRQSALCNSNSPKARPYSASMFIMSPSRHNMESFKSSASWQSKYRLYLINGIKWSWIVLQINHSIKTSSIQLNVFCSVFGIHSPGIIQSCNSRVEGERQEEERTGKKSLSEGWRWTRIRGEASRSHSRAPSRTPWRRGRQCTGPGREAGRVWLTALCLELPVKLRCRFVIFGQKKKNLVIGIG